MNVRPMMAVPDPRHGATRPPPPPDSGARPSKLVSALVPRLLEMLGIGAVAGGALVGALLLVRSPFDGPWRLVMAVAVVFTGIFAGFLMIGFAASLRELEAVRRCLALVARRQRPREP